MSTRGSTRIYTVDPKTWSDRTIPDEKVDRNTAKVKVKVKQSLGLIEMMWLLCMDGTIVKICHDANDEGASKDEFFTFQWCRCNCSVCFAYLGLLRRIASESKSKATPSISKNDFSSMSDLSFSRESFTSICLYHPAFTSDKSFTPKTIVYLPHQKPAISHYKITMLCIPARRKLSHNLQSSGLGLWRTFALMGLHILREERQLGLGTNE